MKWKRDKTLMFFFYGYFFLKWGKFLKVLKILLTFFLKENRIIVYISNKITFGAFQISNTFFWVFVAPCLSVVWVGCLFVWVFSPPFVFVLYYFDFSLIFLYFLPGWKASTACWHYQPLSQMLNPDSVLHGSFRVLHGSRILQKAWGNGGGGNSSVCMSGWKLGTPNPCTDKDGLENILFMSICPEFLFDLHHYISHVFPYCLFGSAKQVNIDQWTWFFTLSPYAGRTRVTVAKRIILSPNPCSLV